MDQGVFAAIVDAVASGQTLVSQLEARGVSPGKFYGAVNRDPTMAEMLGRARLQSAGALLDDALQIADSEPDPQRARVRVDTRLKLAALHNPRVYGQRIELDVRHSIDPTALHAEAMERMRSIRDQAPSLIPQVIEGERLFAPDPSDKQSLVSGDSDPGNVWD